MPRHEQCHETVDPETREDMLAKYKHRCQGCGRCGPSAGGLATLHVHHLTRDPEGMDEHDEENLTVLCRACHSWQHQQTSEEDVPVELTDEDVTALLPQDIEILRILAESGPATTGQIASVLSAELTVTAVRERLWVLMGLDNSVVSRERQIVDQDADTGEWGLAGQIEHSTRGRIPNDAQLLSQRVEDEYVRQALERGCDRDAVMAVLDISRRSTFYKEKRARAYDFPLEAIGNRNGGRPAVDTPSEPRSDEGGVGEETDSAAQQRLDAMASEEPQHGPAADGGDRDTTADATAAEQEASQDAGGGGEKELRGQVRQAITALEAVEGVIGND